MIFRRCFLIATLLVANCFTYALGGDYLLTLQGSNTIGARLAPQLARQFMQAKGYRDLAIQAGAVENEYVVSGKKNDGNGLQYGQIKVTAHGSGTGYIALQNGMADIAMSSRPIKPAEVMALKDIANMRAAWIEHAIAIDGLAILVNPQNTVQSLTITQLAKIFSGEIRNWKQVGGADMAIRLYARDEKSGTWDTFKELVLGSSYPLAESAQRFESSDLLSDKVANDLAAIGFSGLASVHNAKVLGVADEGTGAIRPGSFSVATEDYPLSRRLYLYTPQYLKNDLVREFVEFTQSETGQHIVAETGFVSQNIQPYSYAVASDAPDEYRQLSQTAKRLSLNFRFDEGSPRLDNKAYRDLDRLIEYLQKPENKGLKVHLAGFSDAKNNPVLDRVLSRFRALAVKSVLMEEGLSVEEVQALGSYSPVVSNTNATVKNRNGRVEVWVSDALVQGKGAVAER